MNKVILMSCIFALLCGCKQDVSTTKESVQESSAPQVEVVQEAQEIENIECILEEELPQTLKVTVQDAVFIFTKDTSYHSNEALKQGDTVILYYTGNIEDHPVVRLAEKK